MCTLLTKLHSNLGSEQFNSTQRRQRLKDPSNLASSFNQSLAHKKGVVVQEIKEFIKTSGLTVTRWSFLHRL